MEQEFIRKLNKTFEEAAYEQENIHNHRLSGLTDYAETNNTDYQRNPKINKISDSDIYLRFRQFLPYGTK